jgi:uncharacterized repeat protein (TIGR01451 family)
VGQEVTCPLGTLAASAQRTVKLTVLTAGPGPHMNTASVSSPTEDPEPLNNSSQATVEVLPAADLALEKTVSPTIVDLPGEVTYTLTVANNGPDPARNVIVTDPLPTGETYVSDDAGCKATGQTVTCALGELADKATNIIHLQVLVGLSLGEQTVTNTAQVTSSTADPNLSNNSASAPLQTGPTADVALTKTGPADAVTGEQITWTLTVVDHGPSTAHAVTVVDPLPTEVVYVSSTPSQGTCAFASGKLTCELGTLADGASAQITVTATVTAGPGLLQNTATVSATEPDPELANNSASASTTISAAPTVLISTVTTATTPTAAPAPTPDSGVAANGSKGAVSTPEAPARTRVTLRKVVLERSIAPGGHLDYRLTVRNAGKWVARKLVVCDRLPTQTTVISRGHGRLAQGRICFTLHTLPQGRSHTYALILRADSDAVGRIVNRAIVTGSNFKAAHAQASSSVRGAGVAPRRESRVTG